MMTHLLCLTLLTGPPEATSDPVRECYLDQGLGAAPANASPRLDLPPTVETAEGLVVDPALARELAWRMRCYWRWPEACQITLDAQAAAAAARLEAEREAAAKLRALSAVPPETDWSGLVLAGLVGGLVVGSAVAAWAVVVR